MAHKYKHIGIGDNKRHRILIVELDQDYDDVMHSDIHEDIPFAKKLKRIMDRIRSLTESLDKEKKERKEFTNNLEARIERLENSVD